MIALPFSECGHPGNEDIIIPEPSDDARGIGPSSTAIIGDCYGWGVVLKHRCGDGDCSYESFVLPKVADGDPKQDEDYSETNGLVCEYTKIACRPTTLRLWRRFSSRSVTSRPKWPFTATDRTRSGPTQGNYARGNLATGPGFASWRTPTWKSCRSPITVRKSREIQDTAVNRDRHERHGDSIPELVIKHHLAFGCSWPSRNRSSTRMSTIAGTRGPASRPFAQIATRHDTS